MSFFHNLILIISKLYIIYNVGVIIHFSTAGVAQLVEQWIEDPRVTSSNLVSGNFILN